MYCREESDTAENKPNGKHAQKKWLRTLFYELIRDGGRSSQATHGPSDQNVAARGRSHHRSRGLGVMRQHEPSEVGADPQENPSRKTAAAEAEANLGKVSWLLKKPAERLAGCEKQRGCRSTASAQSSGFIPKCSTRTPCLRRA